jgi:hypothetical protein
MDKSIRAALMAGTRLSTDPTTGRPQWQISTLTAAINRIEAPEPILESLLPWNWEGVATNIIGIEELTSGFGLVPIVKSNEAAALHKDGDRKMIYTDIPRFALEAPVNADEIIGLRAFGADAQLEMITSLVQRRLEEMRQSHELTKELVRFGAISGNMISVRKDKTPYVYRNWFTEFGKAKLTGSISMKATADITQEWVNIKRKSEKKHKGLVLTGGYLALCGSAFYDANTRHQDVKSTFLNWTAASSLREDTRPSGFTIASNIKLFDVGSLSVDGVDFIADDKAWLVPVGPGAFQHRNAPAATMTTVNTPGLPYYAFEKPLDYDKGVNYLTETHYLAFSNYLEAHVEVSLGPAQ